MKTLDQFDLTGRSGLVTGAASGIGLAYAEVIAEAGAKVTLTDIDAEGAVREAQRLCDEGYEARWDACDVSDLAQVAAAFDNHVAAYGGCDIAFANAGLDVGNGFWTPEGERNPEGQIDVYDPDRWDKSIDINLSGVFRTVREAARVMKANRPETHGRRGGAIVITSSNAAEVNEAIVGVPYMGGQGGGEALHAPRRLRTGRLWHPRQRHRARPLRHQYRRWLGEEEPRREEGVGRTSAGGAHGRNPTRSSRSRCCSPRMRAVI